MASNDRVSVRELRQNLSVYLRRVEAGEALEVTQRGRPVALLRPLGRQLSPSLERMIEDGRLHPATAPRDGLEPPLRLKLTVSASQVLQEQREDRL
ncbi:MAG TPA: type II toxin-antitoxin system prevent-host-death family antitoxin [Candidatus Dormibacteraeota bacterium]|jgi:prevent-host-death family protein